MKSTVGIIRSIAIMSVPISSSLGLMAFRQRRQGKVWPAEFCWLLCCLTCHTLNAGTTIGERWCSQVGSCICLSVCLSIKTGGQISNKFCLPIFRGTIKMKLWQWSWWYCGWSYGMVRCITADHVLWTATALSDGLCALSFCSFDLNASDRVAADSYSSCK